MKVVYIVLGIAGIIFGILNMCGVGVLTPFSAGCYAFTAGISFIGEAIRAWEKK